MLSAADLKFLHRLLRVRFRNLRSESGTGIIDLLVPFCFSASVSVTAAPYHGRRKAGTSACIAAALALPVWLALPALPALAQANFDRPGGDYASNPLLSGDPADCALMCERDRRCRAWTFR